MKLSDYLHYDALGLAELIRRGEVTAGEVRAAALLAIDHFNPLVNAVVETWCDAPPAQVGPLHGVPFLVKDLGLTFEGRRSELGSRLAKGMVATANSGLAQRFQQAGLVTLGRTATPELGLGATTEPLATGPTRNPWNTALSAGGSSGGAGAAVAAGMVPTAHATDGGGSIRVPAAVNGLFGLKPSRGRVSTQPAVDQIWSGFVAQGVLSRSVRDSAALLDATQGGAKGDPFQLASPSHTYVAQTQREPEALKIGVMLHPQNGARTAAGVARATQLVARHLQDLGHHVEELVVDLGSSWASFVEMNSYFLAASTAGWMEALAAATKRPLNESTLEPATLALYALGRDLRASDLLGAMEVRNEVTRHLGQFFSRYDVLLTPTLPTLPAALGSHGQEQVSGLQWVEQLFNYSPFTALANVTGVPAMSVPLGVDVETALPIGMQFMAGWDREDRLFRLAGQLERAMPWAARRPVLTTL